MSGIDTKTRDLVAQLWQKSRPVMLERVAVLERAAAAGAAVDGVLRTQAIDEAHKLAGSLGMFGFPRGTDLARTVEVTLESGEDKDLREVVAELKAIVTE